MQLYPKKGNGGHVTSYFVNIGSKEARDAGFLSEDGTSRELRKTVDPVNRRIIIELAPDDGEPDVLSIDTQNRP